MNIKKTLIVTGAMLITVPLAGIGYLFAQHEALPNSGQELPAETGAANPRFAQAIAHSKSIIEEARDELSAPGISISVAHEGEVVWSQALGLANLANREPLTTQTRFHIGSVSKSLSALAVLRLAERGEIDLDEDIRPFVTTFADRPYAITARQLLSHQAGIRHYAFAFDFPTFTEAGLNTQFDTTADALEIFADDPLLFEPDTGFEYTTYGYTLLAAYVEEKTGREFSDLIHSEVFEIAQMRGAQVNTQTANKTNLASGYTAALSRKRVMPEVETNPSYKIAGAGYLATPTDLANFGTAILEGRLLGAELTEEMFEPRTIADGSVNDQRYGLGWRIGSIQSIQTASEPSEKFTLVHHGGTTPGTISILLLIPERNLVVAASANAVKAGGSGSLRDVAEQVALQFLTSSDHPTELNFASS